MATPSGHPHRWEVESPEVAATKGKTTCTGRCALCETKREFPTYGIVEDVGAPKAQWRNRKAMKTRKDTAGPPPPPATPPADEGVPKAYADLLPEERRAWELAHREEIAHAALELRLAEYSKSHELPGTTIYTIVKRLGLKVLSRRGVASAGKRAPAARPSTKPSPTGEVQDDTPDPELRAMSELMRILSPLASDVRRRVINWASMRWGVIEASSR